MRWICFLILAGIACLLQHSVLGNVRFGPDLPLALAMWAMVDGDEDGFIQRVWLVGVMCDLMDPAGGCFHSVVYLLLAAAYLPMRSIFFRTRGMGWGAVAFVAALIVPGIDGLVSGWGDLSVAVVLIGAALTSAVAIAFGWVFNGLPASLSPVGKAGA